MGDVPMGDWGGLLLVAAVGAVGVLHTMVPDHWVPITLLARQRGWSRGETARAALQAGVGHAGTTLVLGLVVWMAGVAVAGRFGRAVDTAASLALIGFGGWIAVSAWRELRAGRGHGHSHGHSHGRGHHTHGHHTHGHHAHGSAAGGPERAAIHGPEQQRLGAGHDAALLSIFEDGVPPRFRVSGAEADFIRLETIRPDGARQMFSFARRGGYWESLEEIPEPHGFQVVLTLTHQGHAHTHATAFIEHAHGHHGHGRGDDHDHDHGHDDPHDGHGEWPSPAGDPLYAPLRGDVAVQARHVHRHRHGNGPAHAHWHDHTASDVHEVPADTDAAPPLHRHLHKTSARTALLLILGSSPMVEGIPAFFAAARYGFWLIALMSVVFAAATIATYVLLCVVSTAGLQRLRLGPFERYGEVISGGFIMLIGAVFWIWPVL